LVSPLESDVTFAVDRIVSYYAVRIVDASAFFFAVNLIADLAVSSVIIQTAFAFVRAKRIFTCCERITNIKPFETLVDVNALIFLRVNTVVSSVPFWATAGV